MGDPAWGGPLGVLIAIEAVLLIYFVVWCCKQEGGCCDGGDGGPSRPAPGMLYYMCGLPAGSLPICLGGGGVAGMPKSGVRTSTCVFHGTLILLLVLTIVTTSMLIPHLETGSPPLGGTLTPLYVGLIIVIITSIVAFGFRVADAFGQEGSAPIVPVQNALYQLFLLFLFILSAILLLIFAFLLLSSTISPHVLYVPLYILFIAYIAAFCFAGLCAPSIMEPLRAADSSTGGEPAPIIAHKTSNDGGVSHVQANWDDL